MSEMFETIVAKIDALSQSNDERFAKVDEQFAVTRAQLDARIQAVETKVVQVSEETRAQLGVKVEAVDTKVALVYDELIAMRAEARRNAAEHETFTTRLDNHDLRILALEKPRRPRR